MDAGSNVASFDMRYSTKLPNARDAQLATLKAQFDLPKTFPEFANAFQELSRRTRRRDQEQLLTTLADRLFPHGNSAKLVASVYDSPLPTFVQEGRDDAWDTFSADNVANQDLPGKGLVTTGTSLGVTVFRLRRPISDSDPNFYSDSRGFMDLLLKGLKLQRLVGDQSIRITSLGRAQNQLTLVDRYGRHWQISN